MTDLRNVSEGFQSAFKVLAELHVVGLLSHRAFHHFAATEHQVFEGPPEVLVERHVDDRIESGVHVSEPESQRGGPVRNELGGERTNQSQNEERQPAAGRRDEEKTVSRASV